MRRKTLSNIALSPRSSTTTRFSSAQILRTCKIAACKIYVSNNVVIDENGFHQCLFRTKRAVTFAEQISEVEAYRPEKRFADAVKGLHLYGAKVVYPDEFMVLCVKAA